MATVTITINTDSAAFEDYPREQVAAILGDIIDGLTLDGWTVGELGGLDLLDVNGNTVGTVVVAS